MKQSEIKYIRRKAKKNRGGVQATWYTMVYMRNDQNDGGSEEFYFFSFLFGFPLTPTVNI